MFAAWSLPTAPFITCFCLRLGVCLYVVKGQVPPQPIQITGLTESHGQGRTVTERIYNSGLLNTWLSCFLLIFTNNLETDKMSKYTFLIYPTFPLIFLLLYRLPILKSLSPATPSWFPHNYRPHRSLIIPSPSITSFPFLLFLPYPFPSSLSFPTNTPYSILLSIRRASCSTAPTKS